MTVDIRMYEAYYDNMHCLQIQWGGKIPKELYIVRTDADTSKENNNDDFKDEVIKKGSKLKLEFDVDKPGCVLKYVNCTKDMFHCQFLY